ncbi:DNA recombination and repair protein RecO [Minicystis rosea]|nr:DNA recombination and repair protein RecO [Minicystis rosea]
MRTRVRTEALLVRSAPFGEADAVVTLLTEERGVISAIAKSARRSSKRFPALEPMHLLRVGLEERPGVDLAALVESAIERPRVGIVHDLDRLEAAGTALRWVRRAAPPHHPEPALWREINAFLDRLDVTEPGPPPRALLAGAGLRLLSAIGWGLDFARCVRCGKACDAGASACLDPAEGGLVCRACGGARLVLRGERRERLLAATLGESPAMDDEDVKAAMEIIDAALAAHT